MSLAWHQQAMPKVESNSVRYCCQDTFALNVDCLRQGNARFGVRPSPFLFHLIHTNHYYYSTMYFKEWTNAKRQVMKRLAKWQWLLGSDQEIKRRSTVSFIESSTQDCSEAVRTKPWRFWGFRLKLSNFQVSGWNFQAAQLKLRISWEGRSTHWDWDGGGQVLAGKQYKCKYKLNTNTNTNPPHLDGGGGGGQFFLQVGFFADICLFSIIHMLLVQWGQTQNLCSDLKEQIPDPTLLVVTRGSAANPATDIHHNFHQQAGRVNISWQKSCLKVFKKLSKSAERFKKKYSNKRHCCQPCYCHSSQFSSRVWAVTNLPFCSGRLHLQIWLVIISLFTF